MPHCLAPRLTVQWLLYCRHLQTAYPYIFSIMMRTHPLTPYSLKLDEWIAWQFDRPEQGDGVVQAFRRDKCEESTKTFRLSGLDPAAQYELTNFDVEGTTRVSGKELVEKGLAIEIKGKPGAAVITCKRLK